MSQIHPEVHSKTKSNIRFQLESLKEEEEEEEEEGYSELKNFDALLDKAKNHTFYNDLGGLEGIQQLVKRVYQYHTQDIRILEFFDFTMAHRFEKMLINFMVGLLGGKGYNQKSMVKAHRRIGGLSDAHFDAFLENLIMAMKHQNVNKTTINEIHALVEDCRDDVTGLSKQQRRKLKNDTHSDKCPFSLVFKNKIKNKCHIS